MDVLTQAVLGSALAQSGSRRSETRLATGVGLLSGLLADADILIRSTSDALLTIEYHRHFTHSIFFIPFGALIAALILWPFLKQKMTFRRLYWFALLGYSLSGFIDACTSYGTHLFWPLSDDRISFYLIAIVDPVFTLALIAGVVVAFRQSKPGAAMAGLAVAACYLLVSFVQLQRAESVVEQLALERGHTPVRSIVKPTMANNILWRSIYEYQGQFYIDAVRVGLDSRVYQGDVIRQFDAHRDLPSSVTGTVLYEDIKRFSRFSDEYIALHPDEEEMIGDIRYSILANGIRPVWGIDFDLNRPQQHAKFINFHQYDDSHVDKFIAMLTNQDLIR